MAALALFLAVSAITWEFGLLGLGLHALSMAAYPQDQRDRNLWLPYYTVAIEALPLEGIERNLSGLTFSRTTGTLFGVVNSPPEIVEISTSGAALRRIVLTGGTDIEGITHVAGDRFIVVDERTGRLSRIDIFADTLEIDLDAARSFTIDAGGFRNLGFEGVSWDQRGRRLLLTKEMWPIKVLSASWPDGVVGSTEPTIAEWRPGLAVGHAVSDLSSVTVHEPTGNIVLLSDRTSAVVEYSAEGKPISLLPLWAGWNGLKAGIPQAEGLAIGPDGAIYIVSEPNLFFRLDRSRPAPWMQGLPVAPPLESR